MDLQLPLPIRLAASTSVEETTATPETPDPPADVNQVAPGPALSQAPNSLIDETHAAGNTSNVSIPLSADVGFLAATGPSNHQFWLKDAKVAEELFTLHRSAQDLVNFASTLIGNRDSAQNYRPIPVMSDGDVLFMTQLSNDIVRSVNGITSIRQHGTRMRGRKIRPSRVAVPPRELSVHRSRGSRENAAARASRGNTTVSGGGGSKRLRKSTEDDQLRQCYKCGRKETPEWRKGPDGLLCNSCGLVYAKQRRKQKMAENMAEKAEKSCTK